MTVRITYVNYKEDVAMSMMRNGEDRTASLKAVSYTHLTLPTKA